MSFWPVALRELCAESRRPSNYWLRTVSAGSIIVVLGLFLSDPSHRSFELGPRLFFSLNATVFGAIWVLAPLMTADCLSWERREGTLGLLFLTPLRPWAIVLGKSLIHGGRALSLTIAMLPMLTLPFIFGGVSVKDVAMAFLLDSCALVLALAGGLLASAWVKDGVRALIAAELLSLFFALAFSSAHYLVFIGLNAQAGAFGSIGVYAEWPPSKLATTIYWQQPLVHSVLDSLTLTSGLTSQEPYSRWGWGVDLSWSLNWARRSVAFQQRWFEWAGGLVGLSMVFLVLIMLLAAWRVARAWKDQPASVRKIELQRVLCTPRFWRSVFRSKMRRQLEGNPVGWLQQYAWSARLTRWGWCLGFVMVECLLISELDYVWLGQF